MSPTLASLDAALREDRLSHWLSAVEATGVSRADRDDLGRTIEHDRALWSQHPDSIASCLLARTQNVAGLDALRASWLVEVEVEASNRPWVRTFDALPLQPGLLRTLSADGDPNLRGLGRVEFPDEDTVTLEAPRLHPDVEAPENRRPERLRWAWQGGEARLEPNLGIVGPAPEEPFPRFETKNGPAFMRADATAAPIELPCPEEATAFAQLGRDGRTIIVHGWHDECAGGFVWFVRERSDGQLEVERALETARAVASVHESADGRVVLATTFGGLVCWSGAEQLNLPILADAAALSPSGERVAVWTGRAIQVWSVREACGETAGPRFPARFSPDGSRLVRGTTLHDGASGAPVARLAATFGRYMEGGPAFPWFHVGDDFVINSHAQLQVWRAADGAPVDAPSLRFPHWDRLAHRDDGRRFAVLRQGKREVQLLAVPSGEVEARVSFDLERPTSLALSPGGERVAVAQGAELEVRTWTGELVLRARHPVSDGADTKRPRVLDRSLQFTDEDQLVSHVNADGWRLFRLIEGTSDPCGRPHVGSQRRPPGWKVEAGEHTVFEHEPTGTRIALPVSGEWVVHPRRRTVLACDKALVELIGSPRRNNVGVTSTDHE